MAIGQHRTLRGAAWAAAGVLVALLASRVAWAAPVQDRTRRLWGDGTVKLWDVASRRQAPVVYEGRRGWVLQNQRLKVIALEGGGHIASLALRSGPGAGVNPLWVPTWRTIEPAGWRPGDPRWGGPSDARLIASIMGHNLCLDFFGGASPEEARRHIPTHGEASVVVWDAVRQRPNHLVYTATLPAARVRVTRTLNLGPNATALWISERVENLSDLDRPIGWQQHVTLGPPFLRKGKTLFDAPVTWGQVFTRPFAKDQRMQAGAQIQWPMVAGTIGREIDLRPAAPEAHSADFAAWLMDPARPWAYFTAVNPDQGVLVGYAWPRRDWPWIACWEENHSRQGNPWKGKGYTRGMEFGTSAFPIPRREAVAMGKLNGTPVYRWLPARVTQTVGYAAFVTAVPRGTMGVEDVQVAGNRIRIKLKESGRTVELRFAR